ncbi:MAG TPA: maleylpyruvate isomerase N-terminal domain-containing protein [Jatrophihabitans sp.]|nr:maleylpyruvate isomerase N-terminal domain-containing protein [Jatrophihabitans sp.]
MHQEELSRRLGWLAAGNELLTGTVAELPDEALAGPSLLPGWSRAHLLGHLARNADALLNLLTWARTGVETPMYPDQASRERDIERSAGQPPAELRADVQDGIDRLAEAIRTMPADAWQHTVRTNRGRPVPGAEVPWMRVREVWVHAVDLGGRAGFADVPVDLGTALLTDAFFFAARHPEPPAVRVLASDADLELSLGRPDATDPVEVRAPVRELLPWALGRHRLLPAGVDWPELPAWL